MYAMKRRGGSGSPAIREASKRILLSSFEEGKEDGLSTAPPQAYRLLNKKSWKFLPPFFFPLYLNIEGDKSAGCGMDQTFFLGLGTTGVLAKIYTVCSFGGGG